MPYLRPTHPETVQEPDSDGGDPLTPDPELIAATECGIAYRAMSGTDGYRRLLDFLESRADKALGELREARFQADSVKLNLLSTWTERELVLVEMQAEIARGIKNGDEASQMLSRFGLLNVPIDFNQSNGETK